MLIKFTAFAVLAAAPAPLLAATPAPTGDQQECRASSPGIRVTVAGMKDRAGVLKLELYPANQADFLKDDQALLKAGKVFRRIQAPVPRQGAVSLCIATPSTGRYAVIVIHQRSGKPKFSIAKDGIGVPGNDRLGRKRPTVEQASVVVESGVATATVTMQYLRGLAGFGPVAE
ncbi:DUF2141 domain-containing protein [Sphingomonas sp. ZT3P38]|uniref:DUF2141 domain-containing protein n=1 Tax=Parasphingomonas zepuensis TaxID=3096161 RepID=UPI002FC868B4